MDTVKKELVIREIVDFHANIALWFRGQTEAKDKLFGSLLANFHPNFLMEGPNGNRMTLSEFEAWLPSAFGKFPDREILVTAITVNLTERHALADYVETQKTDGKTTIRKSSAVFVLQADNAVAWYHLLEDWISQ